MLVVNSYRSGSPEPPKLHQAMSQRVLMQNSPVFVRVHKARVLLFLRDKSQRIRRCQLPRTCCDTAPQVFRVDHNCTARVQIITISYTCVVIRWVRIGTVVTALRNQIHTGVARGGGDCAASSSWRTSCLLPKHFMRFSGAGQTH